MNTQLVSGEKDLRTAQVTEQCRRKLLQYAGSLSELAESYTKDFSAGSKDRQSVIAQKRLWESSQVLRCSLAETAKLIQKAAEETIAYRPMEERKKRLIIQALKREGIRAENPCYVERKDGITRILMNLSCIRKTKISAEEAVDMVSVLLDERLKLSLTAPCLVEREPKSFLLEDEPPFVVLTGFCGATRENEKISGDNYAVIETERGKMAVMLSDGTGSGEEAEQGSGKVLELMEKMLEADYSEEDAICMINDRLALEGEDGNHPTLDLCSVDLYEGSCEIRKAGGAVTFLKHGGQVEVLEASCLPLGIFGQQESALIRRDLQDGDYLVMVTDGVVDAFGEEDYSRMRSCLLAIKEQNPGEIARNLLQGALCASGGRIRDDMTVGVIGIWEN